MRCNLACRPKWPWVRCTLAEAETSISMDHDCARYINTFTTFFSCLFLSLLPSHSFFSPFCFSSFSFSRVTSDFAASDFFSIPRLIFAVARDIRSDSVASYRYMYPASMANGRYIDNNELHTLFTRVRRVRAYYVSQRQCMTHLALSASPYRCPVPLRKGFVDDCYRLLLRACRALANLDWENEIRQRLRW